MTDMDVSQPTSATVSAVVIRCTCGKPESHAGQVCPKGKAVDLGVISYYHRNPLRRLAWRIKQKMRGRTGAAAQVKE